MTVALINATRRLKVINLPHESYCAALGSCACGTLKSRPIASSLTLTAGAVVTGLDDAVLTVPDVAIEVRAGELRVRREAPPPKPKNRSRKPQRRSGRKKAR
ncbi:MAG TPA: hypothetical protein ENK57_02685 [Polyangiaceae bacterium]|nr:hypothetical protein [Polyangiaceae bacterium]